MKLSDLIKQCEKIIGQYGDTEVAFYDHMDWRRLRGEINMEVMGVRPAVRFGNDFIEKAVIDNPRGFTAGKRQQLQKMDISEVIVIRT